MIIVISIKQIYNISVAFPASGSHCFVNKSHLADGTNQPDFETFF